MGAHHAQEGEHICPGWTAAWSSSLSAPGIVFQGTW